MQLIETETGRRARTGARSTRSSSPPPRGEGLERTLAAAREKGRRAGLAARARELSQSVWAPVLAKGLAVFCGMLALAAIGASSLSRGAGVPVVASSLARAPRVTAAGLAPVAVTNDASSLDAPAADGGAPAPNGGEPGADGKPSAGMTADGKVILNRADAVELRHLPGVGPKRADAIVALRAKLGGRFKRVSDLLRVKGIGPKGLKKIEPHVVLDEPRPS
ncbi:MAG TPA: helix-hairpin-helix domain-containing protein [Polyangiaceae bacterium]|jgi:competence protein ComEA|nr:helix-hairpin-helix domain-containing protein [Polyangiaceae bacterium]